MDELYVVARRVLLDALDALGAHRDAVILVGAQAVYLRVGEGDLAVAPYTTDGDLALDPNILAEIPPLEQALMAAGFLPRDKESIGVWIVRRPTRAGPQTPISIDLLVPESVNPNRGRRAARLTGHAPRSARIVRGLDGVIVDSELMRLPSLEVNDPRVHEVRVAGPAGLLVAKLHKIQERHGTSRQSDKDALDILRLLRGTSTEELATRYRQLLGDLRSKEAANRGLDLAREQFGIRSGIGVEMAIRSAGPLGSAEELAASCQLLANDLLRALGA